MKSYSDLIKLQTYEDRLNYLMCYGLVSNETFGFDRYLNQHLYRSSEWKRLRQQIILRDGGCDLGIKGYEIFEKPIIHHINPITIEDLKSNSSIIFDPENLITVSLFTHNIIHYGKQKDIKKSSFTERTSNDTKLW